MPKTAEDYVKEIIGDLSVRLSIALARIEALEAELARRPPAKESHG